MIVERDGACMKSRSSDYPWPRYCEDAKLSLVILLHFCSDD
jgi:hypothetical protein